MVPFGRNEHFVGRRAILEQLLKRIPPDANYDTCQRTALEGLGGTGKTQIALEAIYRLRHQDPACSIFWISASDSISFEKGYHDIGRMLQIPGTKHVQVDIKPLIKEALSQEERAGKWLLVIDSADDPDLLFRGPSLARFLPFSRNGSILFTTRNHQAAVGLEAMAIKVGSMELQEALELLSLGVEPGLVENENDASTKELLGVLTYLPLAISQVSAYLNEYQVSSTQYLQVLHSNDDDMIHLLSHDFEAQGRYNSDYNPVASTFVISFDQLRRSNTLAAEYLQLISFLDENDIPYAILPSAGGKAKMMEAVGGLKAFAFIRQRHDDSFDIHRLVQVSVRRWVMNNGDWDNILKVVINRLNDVLPIPEHQTRDAWARYLPHVLSVLNLAREVAREDYPNMLQLMSKTGTWLNEMGRYGEAEAMFQAVLVTRTHNLGAEHPETLLTMNNIAAILFQQGRLEEATSMLTQVLAMRKRILGDDHPDVLSSMNNLASTLESTGRLDEAMMLQEEVLNKRRRTLGNEHPSTLSAMSNLTKSRFRQGKIEEAVAMSTEALEKKRKIFGNDHGEVFSAMRSHALMLRAQGRVEEAEEMQREARNRMRRILGHEHPDTATATPDISSTSVEQSKVEQEVEVKAETYS
jgi:tetratricopeptide (TPR) repeat protein